MSSFSHRPGPACDSLPARKSTTLPQKNTQGKFFRIAMEKGRKIWCIPGKGHFLIRDKLISSPTPEIKLETANGLLATGKAKAS
jgi:hypothetical protein